MAFLHVLMIKNHPKTSFKKHPLILIMGDLPHIYLIRGLFKELYFSENLPNVLEKSDNNLLFWNEIYNRNDVF